MLLSCAACAALYSALRPWWAHSPAQWSITLLAFTHAVVASTLSGISNFVVGPWAFDGIGMPNTRLQTITMEISLGYFVFDLLWCLRHGESRQMYLHHVCSILSLLLGLYLDESGTEIVAVIAGGEISNPMLQVRRVLQLSSAHAPTLAIANDLLFAFTFLSVRIGFGSALLVASLKSARTRPLVKLGGVIMYGVSVLWAIDIVRATLRRVRRARGTDKPKR